MRLVPLEQHHTAWDETEWNRQMREALMMQGYRALHIKEAHETGVADLMVYSLVYPQTWTEDNIQTINAWLELKILTGGTLDSIVRPAQREFMRDHWSMCRNALFVTYELKRDMLSVRQGNLRGKVIMLKPDPYWVQWKEVFKQFRDRRV